MPPPQSQMQLLRKGRQAENARARICTATTLCLDRHGYAGTSINRVQELAGVSRGALTHHFPSRQSLVAETASRLLQRAVGSTDSRRASLAKVMQEAGDDGSGADPVAAWLVRTWARVVNSREGRALLEILIATRTDPELHRQLAPELAAWDRRMSDAILDLFTGNAGEDAAARDAEARLLWGICRTFLRGLLVQERFTAEPQTLQLYMQRFAGLISPQLQLRAPVSGAPAAPADERNAR